MKENFSHYFHHDKIRCPTSPTPKSALWHITRDSEAIWPRCPTPPAPDSPVGHIPWRSENHNLREKGLVAGLSQVRMGSRHASDKAYSALKKAGGPGTQGADLGRGPYWGRGTRHAKRRFRTRSRARRGSFGFPEPGEVVVAFREPGVGTRI